ncbi:MULTISPECIES: ABC transporter permease [Dinoroseobacter]|jgi:ribose transport system permease protein|nr:MULTISPECIES: ABC transporter permease [Dinoroseobacter]MDD9715741.1 ABC transporter permease [Dinoroseobacter sp. PD6]URF48092.1 ABC transporter permease [Dinoroseobacter shibae]URF52402.1 ABC transporter permease [Dinoroseobacter shibae]
MSRRPKRLRAEHRGLVLGSLLLVALFTAASILVEGFASANNIRSILLLAAFLGLAALGQTMVATVGGLDLSIPFVIGASNILLAYLFGTSLPAPLAILCILAMGALIGVLNGVMSYRIQGQALILTLGVGFAVVGGAQIFTSLGSQFSGTVFSQVPGWFSNIASISGTTFGLKLPPVILIWAAIAASLIFWINRTRAGRAIYAIGGNRTAAARLRISEFRVWVSTYTISGLTAAATGCLLLGFSGGGFVGVGDPYLFTTVAAVVVGGTSLLGGTGGYGATVIGVLVLQVLTSFLVGMGLDYAAQQTVFGLLILPMVALYARAPHIRYQI